jgi:NAD(P)H-nitrite reductase large subunit
VVIDDTCLSCDPHIAIGECILMAACSVWSRRINGSVAAGCATGDGRRSGRRRTKLKLLGVGVGSIGDAREYAGCPGYQFIDEPARLPAR